MPAPLHVWFMTEVLPHEAAIRRLLLRFHFRRDERSDVLQQTYVRILEAARRTQVLNPRAFVLRTAYHLAVDELRRQRSSRIDAVPDFETLNVCTREGDPEREAIGESLAKSLGAAFAALPARCREVLWLRKIEGLSQREVAARLGIAAATVEKQVAKGVRRCAEALLAAAPEAAERLGRHGRKSHERSAPSNRGHRG